MHAGCKRKCGGFLMMILAGVVGGGLALAGIAAGGLGVMLLWNWLTPNLFHWGEIGYLQAVALLVLSRLLVGGFHGCGGYRHMRHARHLDQMTPEERETFKAGMKSKWCGFGSRGSDAKKD